MVTEQLVRNDDRTGEGLCSYFQAKGEYLGLGCA